MSAPARDHELATAAYRRLCTTRQATPEELVAIVAGLLATEPTTYSVPPGQALRGVRGRLAAGRTVEVGIDAGILEPDFADLLPSIARSHVYHAVRVPAIDELLLAIAFGWSRAQCEIEALQPILAAADVEPAWRRFRHEDGRCWAIATDAATLAIRMVDPRDPDPVERRRKHPSADECTAAANRLVEEQRADGFAEEIVTTAAGVARRALGRPECLDRVVVDRDLGLFAVADAFGSARAADIVFAHLRRALVASRGELADALRGALEEADREVLAVAGIGTSVAALVVRGEAVWIARVPRDRVYAYRARKLDLMTPDDWSVGEPAPTVSVIGSGTAHIEVREVAIARGDRFVLCTDGVHRLVEDSALRASIAAVDQVTADPSERAIRLVSRLIWIDEADDDRAVVCVSAEPPRVRPLPKKFDLNAPTAVLREPIIQVVFEPWSEAEGDRIPVALTLRAGDGQAFTARELFDAIETAIAAHVAATGHELGDHIFPESLLLAYAGDIPTYHLVLGS